MAFLYGDALRRTLPSTSSGQAKSLAAEGERFSRFRAKLFLVGACSGGMASRRIVFACEQAPTDERAGFETASPVSHRASHVLLAAIKFLRKLQFKLSLLPFRFYLYVKAIHVVIVKIKGGIEIKRIGFLNASEFQTFTLPD